MAGVKVFDVSAVGELSDSGDIDPDCPLLLNVTVYESAAVHWAYSVVDAVNEYVAPLAYAVPDPFALVFQPEKV